MNTHKSIHNAKFGAMEEERDQPCMSSFEMLQWFSGQSAGGSMKKKDEVRWGEAGKLSEK
jgi:hypothetical protein